MRVNQCQLSQSAIYISQISCDVTTKTMSPNSLLISFLQTQFYLRYKLTVATFFSSRLRPTNCVLLNSDREVSLSSLLDFFRKSIMITSHLLRYRPSGSKTTKAFLQSSINCMPLNSRQQVQTILLDKLAAVFDEGTSPKPFSIDYSFSTSSVSTLKIAISK